MQKLLVLTVVGFIAQLIDGSLGMAYGVTSSSLMLASGLAPAAASASVHLAEIGTTLASGTAHWRFGNVDWPIVRRLALPGAVGAFVGATVLSNVSTTAAKPLMAGVLTALGIAVIVRFTFGTVRKSPTEPARPVRFLGPLGLVAGFVDASGGGGWGPVATPTLLASGRIEPRKVIGSVDTSEFVVAVAASIGFFIGIGGAGVSATYVAALLVGGLVAAPLAAYVVRVIPAEMLGPLVGGFIVALNARVLLDIIGVSSLVMTCAYALILASWASAVGAGLRRSALGRTEAVSLSEVS